MEDLTTPNQSKPAQETTAKESQPLTMKARCLGRIDNSLHPNSKGSKKHWKYWNKPRGKRLRERRRSSSISSIRNRAEAIFTAPTVHAASNRVRGGLPWTNGSALKSSSSRVPVRLSERFAQNIGVPCLKLMFQCESGPGSIWIRQHTMDPKLTMVLLTTHFRLEGGLLKYQIFGFSWCPDSCHLAGWDWPLLPARSLWRHCC